MPHRLQVTQQQLPLSGSITLAGWQASAGGAGAERIVALHGWLDNANSFLPLARELCDYNWLSLDLAGHGHSEHRAGGAAYHFVDYVGDLLQLCRQQQWQPLTLIGHSMGAMIATAFAAAFPEHVARLVLIDAMGLMTTPVADSAAQLRQGLVSRLQREQKQMPVYSSVEAAALARQKQSDFDVSSALILAQRGTKPCQGGVTWRSDIRLREVSPQRYCPAQVQALLQQIQCPVLALLATDGLSLTQHAVQRYADDLPQLQRVQLAGGHHLHMTNTRACADSIRLFLSQNHKDSLP